MNRQNFHRRRFLVGTSMIGIQAAYLSQYMLSGVSVAGTMEDRIATPPQTEGPFYPKPKISDQEFYDADLTCKAEGGKKAEGEFVVVQGQIVDLDGNPLAGSVVEVWQACNSGRYNHPDDQNQAPIDPNFQYWARMTTDELGRYSFKTIQPGKYPGRTPHIHYKVEAKGWPDLVTQMYFENRTDDNRKDGIFKALSQEQQRAVTVAFEKSKDHDNLPLGNFVVTMGPKGNRRSTPPM